MMVPKAIFKGAVTALAVLASMLVQANMFKPSVAQQIKMGEQAAPGGRRLDLVNINGRLMASMQVLAKKVERLEKELA